MITYTRKCACKTLRVHVMHRTRSSNQHNIMATKHLVGRVSILLAAVSRGSLCTVPYTVIKAYYTRLVFSSNSTNTGGEHEYTQGSKLNE